jgi:Uma2 family endonuclease
MPYNQRDTQNHTYADYLVWSAEYGNELIDGVAYVREPPSPSRCHQKMVGDLYYQIRLALEGKPCEVYMAPLDVRLPKAGETDDQVDTVVQPDLFIACDPRKLDERGMRGAPDWIAEVLSPGTASYDQKKKVPVYERAGVPEVWLIHPTDRTLTIYCLKKRRYGQPKLLDLKGATRIACLPGISIDWDRLLL